MKLGLAIGFSALLLPVTGLAAGQCPPEAAITGACGPGFVSVTPSAQAFGQFITFALLLVITVRVVVFSIGRLEGKHSCQLPRWVLGASGAALVLATLFCPWEALLAAVGNIVFVLMGYAIFRRGAGAPARAAAAKGNTAVSAMVEAAAIAAAKNSHPDVPWDRYGEQERALWRGDARAALESIGVPLEGLATLKSSS